MDKGKYNDLCGCLILLFLIGGCTGYSMYRAYKKKVRTEYVKDSIINTPHYKDNVRKQRILRQNYREHAQYYEQKDLIGFVYNNAKEYHTHFHIIKEIKDDYLPISVNFQEDEIDKLRFITRSEVEENDISLCPKCEEYDDVLLDYEHEEFLSEEPEDYY